LIVFDKQHQYTFKNDMRVQLSLSLHFWLVYLLTEMTWKITCLLDCWWLWKELALV